MSTKTAKSVDEEDDAEWARVERLFDTPQEQWGTEQWRDLATYLGDAHQQVVAVLCDAVSAHEQTMGLLKDAIAREKKAGLHTKLLRLLDEQVRAGRVSIKVKAPRRKAGAPKKVSPEQESKLRAAMVVLAARHGPTNAAKIMAGWQLKREGLDPNSQSFRTVAKMKRYTKTLANKIGPARSLTAQEVIAEKGRTLAALDTLQRLKLVPPSRKAKPPKNPK